MLSCKISMVGASSGVILSNAAMERLGVKNGDTIHLTEAPGGGCRLTPVDPEFRRQIAIAEEIMQDDHEVLKALAK